MNAAGWSLGGKGCCCRSPDQRPGWAKLRGGGGRTGRPLGVEGTRQDSPGQQGGSCAGFSPSLLLTHLSTIHTDFESSGASDLEDAENSFPSLYAFLMAGTRAAPSLVPCLGLLRVAATGED